MIRVLLAEYLIIDLAYSEMDKINIRIIADIVKAFTSLLPTLNNNNIAFHCELYEADMVLGPWPERRKRLMYLPKYLLCPSNSVEYTEDVFFLLVF